MAKTVLIVEDDIFNMKLFHDLIEAYGYNVLQARTGEEALAFIDDRHPDLIIMDIQLGRLSGLELTRRIKGDDATKSIPIVVVTAFATAADAERISQAGCDAYLTKPVSVDALISAVQKFVE